MTARQVLVVADDLTGATDTGNEFARRGYGTIVTFDHPGHGPSIASTGSAATEDADAAVLVVNTESRYADPETAGKRVAAAVRRHPATLVYKKVDSTLRGNLVSEIEAAVESAGADLAVVAPAFPANGRLTACGVHLVDGRLVTDTDAGRDPDAPVATAHLPSLLAESRYLVEHVPIDTVADGGAAVSEAITGRVAAADGPVLVIGDAAHERHLEAIGTGTTESDADPVFVGSAGLARHVPLGGPDDEPAESRFTVPQVARSRVLGIAGSASPVTVEQVAAVPQDQVVALDAPRAVREPEAAIATAVSGCADRLDHDGVALLASVTDPDDVDAALAAGRDAGLSETTVRDRIARTLAETAAAVHDADPLSGLFVTGGAVAGAVLSGLGASGVRLAGESVDDGVPVGRLVGGRGDGTPIVTKAGAFGERTTINACLAYLRGENGR